MEWNKISKVKDVVAWEQALILKVWCWMDELIARAQRYWRTEAWTWLQRMTHPKDNEKLKQVSYTEKQPPRTVQCNRQELGCGAVKEAEGQG